ncbi:aldehyde dehydrogenase [Fusarium albosuccineum]|uniref:Aldehyde dehydrogenase n=1 Tax=Fusarium albosuccineum TaxID=1237068 RepID=A0A8H4LGR3_9HYPO|nr:aldehyde dehydrogenase [Fusarium albosuccineum]
MATPQETSERRTKRRAAMSCDRCKARKTKCVDPIPGPCQFCASISAPCHLDPSRRRQRPYYRVSEEEFRYMTQILEHFLPNTELNLQTLKSYVDSIGSNASDQAFTPSGSEAISPSYALVSPPPIAEDAREDDSVITDEISELHKEVGRLRVDSRGIQSEFLNMAVLTHAVSLTAPGHVGPSSAYLFHSAVRSIKHPRQPNTPSSEVLAPLTASEVVPPPTPESSLGVKRTPRQVNLPHRELCNSCIARFFQDVHSVYWLFSAEQLHATLDRIYSGDATSATPAALCSLYSILAITCESEMQKEWSDTSMRPSVTYLTLAKAVVPALYDDADSDSVRALCLLGLALSCSMFGNTAYIYIGSAARIAFTLGWHVRDHNKSRLDLQEQMDMRLFCTLYLLDLDTSLTYGNPPAIDEGTIINAPKAPSEQMLSPGSNMPLDYLETSCQLAYLRRDLTRLLYQRPVGGSHRLSTGAVTNAVSRLESWYTGIPSHLRNPAQVPKFHERSVAVLHLRYWSAMVYATRPFLLYSALKEQELDQSPKQRWFRDFSTACIDAAQKSLEVVLFLAERNLLSSLVVFDCGCILEDMQVFLLAMTLSEPSMHKRNVEACLLTLQGMEQAFWPKHALPEVIAQLRECGILSDEPGLNLTDDQPPGLVFLDFAQQGEQGEP